MATKKTPNYRSAIQRRLQNSQGKIPMPKPRSRATAAPGVNQTRQRFGQNQQDWQQDPTNYGPGLQFNPVPVSPVDEAAMGFNNFSPQRPVGQRPFPQQPKPVVPLSQRRLPNSYPTSSVDEAALGFDNFAQKPALQRALEMYRQQGMFGAK